MVGTWLPVSLGPGFSIEGFFDGKRHIEHLAMALFSTLGLWRLTIRMLQHVSTFPNSDELRALGCSAAQADEFSMRIAKVWEKSDAVVRWQRLVAEILRPNVPFAVHRELFSRNFGNWAGHRPAWIPAAQDIERANLTRLMMALGHASLEELTTAAKNQPATFWNCLIAQLGIRFHTPPQKILEQTASQRTHWLLNARLNIAESCFQHDSAGVIALDEKGCRQQLSIAELKAQALRFAGALRRRGLQFGDAVGLVAPLSAEAVVAYLGIVLAGGVAVGIAESFAAPEIERRIGIAAARLAIIQHSLFRGGKELPLYERLTGANLPPIIVLKPPRNARLRSTDLPWEDVMSSGEPIEPTVRAADDPLTILFSSGTTGEPKAIPWHHTTPIQCAADGYLYQDLHPGDVVSWPTSMGWMMGPWLIFAGLINGAKLMLFDGHPVSNAFVKSVEAERVTVLGVVPSLVAAWQQRGLWDTADWSRIRLFSSTGECSHPDQMLALMSRANYRPVIEYCGGTELAGGYLASTVLRPNVPSCFNQVAFGLDLVIPDESGTTLKRGEAFLAGSSIGYSTSLLNADHDTLYYSGTPHDALGQSTRRHGDVLQEVGNGFYRVLGRADDAMNLSGIKVSAVEIERVCNTHPLISECAAVAQVSSSGAHSELHLYVVLHAKHEQPPSSELLQIQLQQQITEQLSPQFRVRELHFVAALPRTASNKIVRRSLRLS